jgi:hypothetical protein
VQGVNCVLPWEDIADEAERLSVISKGGRVTGRTVAKEGNDHEELENDQQVGRDGTDPHNEVIFGRSRPDSVVINWDNKVIYVLKFMPTSDQRRDYRERWKSRAIAQRDILI